MADMVLLNVVRPLISASICRFLLVIIGTREFSLHLPRTGEKNPIKKVDR